LNNILLMMMHFWNIKTTVIVLIAGIHLILSMPTAEASWLIEKEKFRMSAHGSLSCQDCHAEILERTLHPDPADVNKTLTDFFDPEQCAACHDDVFDKIDEGDHAGQAATPWQRFDVCIECHHPHYQRSSAENLTAADFKAPAEQAELPAFSEEDQACLRCHQALMGIDPESADKAADVCLHCHRSGQSGKKATSESHSLIDIEQYATTPHKDIACSVCHPQAMAFGHGAQVVGDCGQCHMPHDEKVAHDAHAGVACGACHLNTVTPSRSHDDGSVTWRRIPAPERTSDIHRMRMPVKEESCRRCHHQGNPIGAAAMVLPPKSVICMPCHAATFSVGDTITRLSLLAFLFGVVAVGSIWFSAGRQNVGAVCKLLKTVGTVFSALFSNRFFTIAGSLILDGLLQRRLFKISKERWLLHAMVFFPFMFRFGWGMLALIASLRLPGWSGTGVLLDKNYPVTAFLFDFCGLMILCGAAGMLGRRWYDRTRRRVTQLPPSDWPAYALLGGTMLVGFVLEGMRMTMTGSPAGAPYAFVGDAVGRLLVGLDITGIYGYAWYLHAGFTGAFLAYLPFSRLYHMIMAPVSLAINAASRSD
jgi:nitrate reductase gamma subunit